uniref:Uncharacterized protein n=1 Tax=Daphnia galeata TaxID=27404 RepID=A0A8J2WPC0_9CRUS|nr:unnamed protein product [Daphnia galeata]
MSNEMSPIKKKKQPIKKNPSQPEKVSQGQNLAKGNFERAARLEHLITREGYTALNQAIMDDKSIPEGVADLPDDNEIGMADLNSSDTFRKVDWFTELKTGLRCPICFGKCCSLHDIQKMEKKAASNVIKPLKYQLRPMTEHPVNHVSYIGRSSRGFAVHHSSYENLIKFSLEWSDFPNKSSHVYN